MTLETRQKYPLHIKIGMSKTRIRRWLKYYNGNCYISYSGGKDSTVLLHLVRSIRFPYDGRKIPAVFSDTGLEYPEIRDFVNSTPDVTWIKPEKTFKDVIEQYGFPVISKEVSQRIEEAVNTKSSKLRDIRMGKVKDRLRNSIPKKWRFLVNSEFKISDKCCKYLKKKPFEIYEKKTGRKCISGIMAIESDLRGKAYREHGCNLFDSKRPKSNPLMFWTEKDIWDYIKLNNLKYSKIYDMGYKRTGCMFCAFGAHLEKGTNRFQNMEKTHPKQYNYCMNKLGMKKLLWKIGVNTKPTLF